MSAWNMREGIARVWCPICHRKDICIDQHGVFYAHKTHKRGPWCEQGNKSRLKYEPVQPGQGSKAMRRDRRMDPSECTGDTDIQDRRCPPTPNLMDIAQQLSDDKDAVHSEQKP